jgi:hypothetical protein
MCTSIPEGAVLGATSARLLRSCSRNISPVGILNVIILAQNAMIRVAKRVIALLNKKISVAISSTSISIQARKLLNFSAPRRGRFCGVSK